MKTYFVRHTEKLSIDKKTREELWNKNYIAIHFPYPKGHDRKSQPDSISLEPSDYEGTDAQAIRTLNEIAKNGGYICSTNSLSPDECLIGKIEPNSNVEIYKGFWDEEKERPAKYKTLKLKNPKKIKRQYLTTVLVGVPRQGTIREWKACKDRIEHLIEKKKLKVNFDNLLPAEQEVMCSEFLRTELTHEFGLPKAEILLTPIGRTLETVDICALSKNEENIFAQVTFHKFGSKQVREKIKRLTGFDTSKNKLILFCDCEKQEIKDGVFIFPLREVYNKFILTNNGKMWVRSIQKTFEAFS